MILDQVLRRKMQAISMDDTLQVAARKLRALDQVNSPLVASFEEQDLDDTVQILPSGNHFGLFIRGENQKRLARMISMQADIEQS